MEENLPVDHVRIKLYDVIRTRLSPNNPSSYSPPNQLIYKYPRNTDYKSHINYINYIFNNNQVLDNETFFTRLYKLTLLNKEQIEDKIKSLLPKKVSTITKQDKYEYHSMLNNNELFHLLLSMPIILTSRYNYTSGETKLQYYGYQNIAHIIENTKNTENKDKPVNTEKTLKTEIKFFLEENINLESLEYLYLTLNNYNKTVNNEYYIITKYQLRENAKETVSKEMLDFYFPEQIESRYKKLTQTDYNAISSNIKLTTVNKSVYNDTIISIKECYCKNIIFESLANNVNIKYEIAKLYNNTSTSYY
jgi:hypothetical protein